MIKRLLPLLVAVLIPQWAFALTVVFPLPSKDFDPTESAVPWKILRKAGHQVVFATPAGLPAQADPIMVTGEGLGLLKGLLAATPGSAATYEEMASSEEFLNPISWDELNPDDYDALVLVGGHAKGMREYLEAEVLQNFVSRFFAEDKKVGAICHGVLLAARSKRADGKSVLFDRKTTSLNASQELLAWKMTKLWLGDYYRTYAETLESEVSRLLKNPKQFDRGPLPIARDTEESDRAGFAVRDGNYLSARWPGDAHRFGNELVKLLAD